MIFIKEKWEHRATGMNSNLEPAKQDVNTPDDVDYTKPVAYDVEGKPLYAAIPDDPASNAMALTKSQPLLLAAPSAPSTRAYHELVRKMQQTQILAKDRLHEIQRWQLLKFCLFLFVL